MKKIYLIALIGVLFSCKFDDAPLESQAKPESDVSDYVISLEDAKTELEDILIDLTMFTRSEQSDERIVEYAYSVGAPLSTKAEDDIEPYLHIFNFEEDQGFAIMSGDERVAHLLALTFKGELKQGEEIDNPGLAFFLDKLASYYNSEIKRNSITNPGGLVIDPGSTVKNGTWKTITFEMNYGNCKVKWGQRSPYNNYCPFIEGTTRRTVTGCVATAVAQLMSVFSYPDVYNNYYFDWENMNKFVSTTNNSGSSLSAKSQIARLMQQLGLSNNLDMDYGETSSAPTSNIPRTLRNFGFIYGGVVRRYSTEDVVNELKSGFPAIFVGYSKRTENGNGTYHYSNGHCWLAHGLMAREYTVSTFKGEKLVNTDVKNYWYPLCNLGWNGTADGYYLSEVFDAADGPVYEWNDESTKAEDTEGEDRNYQFYLQSVTGIRSTLWL